MSVEAGINREREAEIIELFRETDSSIHIPDGVGLALNALYRSFCENFRCFDFAELEQLFRKHEFNTHFLAVPTDRSEQPTAIEEIIFDRFPGQRILDVYNKMVHNTDVPMRYRGTPYASLAALEKAAEAYGIEYNEQTNLARLRVAGGRFVSLPGLTARTPVSIIPSLVFNIPQPGFRVQLPYDLHNPIAKVNKIQDHKDSMALLTSPGRHSGRR